MTKNVDIYLYYVIKISVIATYLLNVFSASLVNFHVISQFARGARIRRRNTCPPFRESCLSRKSLEILLFSFFLFLSPSAPDVLQLFYSSFDQTGFKKKMP